MNTIPLQIFVFALLIVPPSSNSCSDKVTQTESPYRIVIEDQSTSYSFPSGVYYSYVFTRPYSRDFQVHSVFNRAINAGVRLRDAWYKGYSGGCAPPGTNIIQEVEVEPVLLLRLDTSNPTVEQLGFLQIQSPDMGLCKYRINRYIFLD